jgi:trans-aconitate methyltransferase
LKTAPAKVVWNPADYAANSVAQLAWARELIAKLHLQGDERVLDVGCGDGKITAELARALPRGCIVGLDGSAEMLRFAREHFSVKQFPNLEFVQMDARQLRLATPFDVIFSNATLHWVDDHPAFLRGAAACLKPGGRLIISCGGKGNAQDVFVALRATLRTKRWRSFFRNLTAPYFFHRPEDYEKWLPRFGFKPTLVRLVNKEVQFAGRDGLAAWIRTTWLPYTQRVPAAHREEFIADVALRFVTKHPLDAAGNLTARMVRLEIDAHKTSTTLPDK